MSVSRASGTPLLTCGNRPFNKPQGDRPGAVAALGLLAIAGGPAVASTPEPADVGVRSARRRPDLAPGQVLPTADLAAVAVLGLGLVYVLLARAATGGAGMAVLAFRTTSLTLLAL